MDTKEMIGYICRWSLLTVSMALVMASAGVILAATAGVPDGVANDVVLSDALWAQPGELDLALFGHIEPGPADWDMPHLLTRGADRSVSLVSFSSIRLLPPVPNPPAGHSEIEILPVPYCREAFQTWSQQLVVLGGHEKVYLVDARMAALAEPSPPQQMLDLLADLRKRGQAVFICSDIGESFVALRRAVDRLDPEAMLVCTNRYGRQVTTLPKYYLADSGLSNVKTRLTVITDDPACARQVVSMRIQTHLIGEHEDAPPIPSDYLTTHDTIADLRSRINWQPAD